MTDDKRTDGPVERKVAAEREEASVQYCDTIGYTHVSSSATTSWRNRSRSYSRQYDSLEALHEYARDSDRLHLGAWQEHYGDGTRDDAAVGIWHETYAVDPDEYETVYNTMPPHGLAAADGTEVVTASGQRDTAAGRMGHTDGSDSATTGWRNCSREYRR